MASEDAPPVELMRRAGCRGAGAHQHARPRTSDQHRVLALRRDAQSMEARLHGRRILRRGGGRDRLGHEPDRTRQRHRRDHCAIRPTPAASPRSSRRAVACAQGNPSSVLDMPINAQIMLVNGVLARNRGRRAPRTRRGDGRAPPRSPDDRCATRRAVAFPSASHWSRNHSAVTPTPASPRAFASRVEPWRRPVTRWKRSSRRWSSSRYFAWTELMMTSLAVVRPLLQMILGAGGQRFLELADIEYSARDARVDGADAPRAATGSRRPGASS